MPTSPLLEHTNMADVGIGPNIFRNISVGAIHELPATPDTKDNNMENKKRPLRLFEKLIIAVAILLFVAAVPLLILSFYAEFEYASPFGWMCICLGHVLINLIRWEYRTKHNVFEVWFYSVVFVIFTVLLCVRLAF